MGINIFEEEVIMNTQGKKSYGMHCMFAMGFVVVFGLVIVQGQTALAGQKKVLSSQQQEIITAGAKDAVVVSAGLMQQMD